MLKMTSPLRYAVVYDTLNYADTIFRKYLTFQFILNYYVSPGHLLEFNVGILDEIFQEL